MVTTRKVPRRRRRFKPPGQALLEQAEPNAISPFADERAGQTGAITRRADALVEVLVEPSSRQE
jgi:hypothetical protein